MPTSSPTHQEIAQHAYQIYVRNGRKDGHELEHWLEAEAELRNRMAGSSSSSVTPKAAATNGSAKAAPAPKAKETPAAPAATPAGKAQPAGKKGSKSAK
ncbi:MAG TPA: DUF2934 domain-containing protein [Prosthecobacter sp.]|nr:DUF2934 domain-containing protein [Prosthecobacter sp.]